MIERPCAECDGWHVAGPCPHAVNGWLWVILAASVAVVLVLR